MKITYKHYQEFLLKYLGPQKLKVTLMVVTLLTSIGLKLVIPQILARFIDTALSGKASTGSDLAWLAGLFMVVALFQQLTSSVATYVSQDVGWIATNNLRNDLALHVLKLDMSFHNARTPGELIERIDGDITAMSNFFSQFVVRILGSVLLLVGVLVVLFFEDWRVGVGLSFFTLLFLYALNRSRDFAVPQTTKERESNAQLFGFLEERLSGMEDIRANGGSSFAMLSYFKITRNLLVQTRRSWVLRGCMWMITIALFTLSTATTFGLGAYLFENKLVTIGTVYLLFNYSELLVSPIEELTRQLQDLQKAAAGIVRVQELYHTQSRLQDAPDATAKTLADGPLAVELHNLSFAYSRDPQAEMILKNVSLELPPGRVLGLLGRTGSGKTTITRLLFRLYDPTAGVIRLGGQDITSVKLTELHRHIGIVTQDVQLFHASVRDNLTFFDQSIPDARILAVLDDLGLNEWYNKLADGLDTELDAGGGGLSAGEAQLLAFVRVFLKDPGLVILDEASSRLDPATENLIERAVDKLLHNRTGIVIAHRLGTVERADDILILENGQVGEYGPRALLVRDSGSRFYSLLQTGLEEALA